MQSDLPFWVVILQALTTPTLAGFAVYIAFRQYTLGREKLKLDLFEKRYIVYSSIRKVLANFVTQGAFNASLDNPIHDFDVGTKDATFLFDQEIVKYVDDLRIRLNQLVYHAKMVSRDPPAADRELHIDREHSLSASIQTDLLVVQEKFAPYLNFKKLNAFW